MASDSSNRVLTERPVACSSHPSTVMTGRMTLEQKDPAEYGREELNAAVHREVFGREVKQESPPAGGGLLYRDAETGDPVPDYVEDNVRLMGRLNRWGYYFRGERAGLWGDASVQVEGRLESAGRFTRTAETLDRACCEVALDVARHRRSGGGAPG